MASRFPAFSQSLAQEQTTRRIWYGLATVHDIEEYDCITEGQFYQQVFTAHFGQLAVIFFWISGILFHVGWQGNFNTWTKDVIQTIPIAHTILDPHFSEIALTAFGHNSSNNPVNNAYSGIYHWWFTIGMRTEQDLFIGAIFLLTCAVLALTAAQVHQQMVPDINWFKNAESRLNHHLAALIGTSSLAWAGHIVHIAIPAARGQYVRWHNLLETAPKQGLAPFFTGNWIAYNGKLQIGNALNVNDKDESLLTFIGGLNPATGSLWLTDIAHHHLAIAVLFIIAGHMYRTNFGIGHSIQSIMNKHIPGKHFLGNGHFNLHAIVSNSLNLQLALALAAISTVTSLTAQHMYALPAFAFIGLDIITQATLYTHHQYIAGILMMGAFAHGSIFLVKDYSNKDAAVNVLARVIAHKEAIISHLSWVCLLVGFHTLGIYVHNDVMIAFGSMDKQILIEPIFAQCIQSTHGKTAIGWSLLLSSSNAASSIASKGIWLSGWMDAINNASNPLFLDIGPGDFLVHHAIALGLHTTSLIVIKGALDARGSKLMPDKKEFGYSFPCDGPGRGGTCDISAWDAVYLAFFWMLNTIGWVTFYWHWKHIVLWKGSEYQFNESSTYLMGWLRDYLWLYSAQLINGYTSLGMNNNSIWIWMFLFGHFVWALGFMFLISWRGYWQELIETVIWAHEQTPIASMLHWKEKPVALSIVQARLVGLTHFTVGYILTYAAFIVASTAGIIE